MYRNENAARWDKDIGTFGPQPSPKQRFPSLMTSRAFLSLTCLFILFPKVMQNNFKSRKNISEQKINILSTHLPASLKAPSQRGIRSSAQQMLPSLQDPPSALQALEILGYHSYGRHTVLTAQAHPAELEGSQVVILEGLAPCHGGDSPQRRPREAPGSALSCKPLGAAPRPACSEAAKVCSH